MKKAFIHIAALFLCFGCASQPQDDREQLYVSILPLRSIVGEIVGDDFRIECLVPPGASPETFEPTPRQIIGLNEAKLVFSVGLIDFERSMLTKLRQPERIVDLSRGTEPIEGSCSHAHHGHSHPHGVDPHIWTSPRELQIMADNAFKAICACWPDSVKYVRNYERLATRLAQLESDTGARLAQSGVRTFVIYHPALTYYARAYGLRQVAIEEDGKEPSAKRLAQLIEEARAEGVSRIFYQSQFPVSTVEVIAGDIGAETVAIDPLAEDAIGNIERITGLLTGSTAEPAEEVRR